MGPAQEFKPGDKAWAGAQILELPDLSTVHLATRLDESDRGRLQMARRRRFASTRFRTTTITRRLRTCPCSRAWTFSSWPPQKNFDMSLTFSDADVRLRPGMSGLARIAVGKIPDQLLLPSGAIFPSEGRLVVYRRTRSGFDAVPIEIVRRGREQVAVKGSLTPGDHVSLVAPKPAGSQAK